MDRHGLIPEHRADDLSRALAGREHRAAREIESRIVLVETGQRQEVALGEAIDELYWRSIDRPKTAHWLAAYDLVRSTLTPNPASQWNRGLPDEILAGIPKGYTDAVLDDEFPLSMFYEALEKKMRPVISSTAGITGSDV